MGWAGLAAAGATLAPGSAGAAAVAGEVLEPQMQFGLVTYLWGQDWDLPTLIGNCEKSGVLGVELRTEHAHGVEPALDAKGREEVKRRFADSPVTCLGPGSNERYDDQDPGKLKAAVEATKEFIRLSHDIGASGVKVKPDRFHEGVERERTIEQIGKALKELGEYAEGFGQEVRLEVHGQCAELPTIKAIMDVADNPQVAVCWNSNEEDLKGEGLEHNFNLVKDRFGATAHVRELNVGDYPYGDLMKLFVGMGYAGWVLLEARTAPADRVAALVEQREIFEKMVGKR